MKYSIKKARGFYRVTRSMQGNMWVYTIMADDTTIGRITYNPVRTLSILIIEGRLYNVWKPRPSFFPPRFDWRCVE